MKSGNKNRLEVNRELKFTFSYDFIMSISIKLLSIIG